MISTLETKEAQLKNGYYQSGTGPQQILILGSCRTIPYLAYLMRYNEGKNQFTIRRIDACDWAVENVDLTTLEKDERILSVLKSADIFAHEHLENYGFCNTSKDCEKNVYHFGMNAPIDISIPNWHDHLILENDWVDYGGTTPDNYIYRGEKEIYKFASLCNLTSFPEMALHFIQNWRSTRFFYRPNHISAAFSLYIFRLLNDKFLHLDLTDEFWAGAATEDLFKEPCTQVTERDRSAYNLTW